jgi:hypothetical protein
MDALHEVLRCAVCGSVKDARRRQGLKRVLCRECAEAAYRNEDYRRSEIGVSLNGSIADGHKVNRGHLPDDGGLDTYEGALREYEE